MPHYPKVDIPVPGVTGTLWAGPRPLHPEDTSDVDRVVCLIPAAHLPRGYAAAAREAGHHFEPVPDFGVPEDPVSWDATVAVVHTLLQEGCQVLVHCQAGCGRTGTLCAAVLVRAGLDPLDAIAHFRAHRGCGPETEAQRGWVQDFAQRYA